MINNGKSLAGPGEPVNACVRTKHMLTSMRTALGMSAWHKIAASREIRKSPRVAVQLPFSYRVIRNNMIMPEPFQGTILNISYNGMLAELNQPLPADSEIKLKLDTLLSHTQTADVDPRAAEIYARIIDTRPINGWDVSGIEFNCVSAQSEKLLMHCMLHITHAGNTVLDEHLRQHEREVTNKTDAWQITKRIILATLLAASTALLYLVWVINDALTVFH